MNARATAALMLLLLAGGEHQKVADDVEAHDRTVSRLEKEEKKAAAALRAIRDQLEQERAYLANLTEAGPDNATSVVAAATDHEENPSSRTLLVEHPLDPSNSTSLVEDADEVMGHSTAWWTWAGVLGMEIVMGFSGSRIMRATAKMGTAVTGGSFHLCSRASSACTSGSRW